MIQVINNTESRQISVLQAMELIQWAWSKVSSQAISNSVHHAGFDSCETDLYQENNSLYNFKSALEAAAAARCNTPQGLDAEIFACFDDSLIVLGKLSSDEIIASVIKSDQEVISDMLKSKTASPPPPTTREVQTMSSIVPKYYQSNLIQSIKFSKS